jgi:mRNA interferase MazF
LILRWEGEIKKKQPAVIVSNDAANKHLNRVQVVPLTSNVGKAYPSEARVTFQGKLGKAMADRLTTVSKQRMIGRGGGLPGQEMGELERAIQVQLGLM